MRSELSSLRVSCMKIMNYLLHCAIWLLSIQLLTGERLSIAFVIIVYLYFALSAAIAALCLIDAKRATIIREKITSRLEDE